MISIHIICLKTMAVLMNGWIVPIGGVVLMPLITLIISTVKFLCCKYFACLSEAGFPVFKYSSICKERTCEGQTHTTHTFSNNFHRVK